MCFIFNTMRNFAHGLIEMMQHHCQRVCESGAAGWYKNVLDMILSAEACETVNAANAHSRITEMLSVFEDAISIRLLRFRRLIGAPVTILPFFTGGRD